MNIITKIKELFTKTKNVVSNTKEDIIQFMTDHASQIAAVMKIMDTFYDNLKGSEKMKAVLAFFITAVNNKFGTSLNAENTANTVVTQIETKFEEIYQTEVKISNK